MHSATLSRTPVLELPIRRVPATSLGRLRTWAASLLTIRNGSAVVLSASSAVVLWITMETAATLAMPVTHDSPSAAMTAGIVVGAAGGAIAATFAGFACHIARIVPQALNSPFLFPVSVGIGMVAGCFGGGASAYGRWTTIQELLLDHATTQRSFEDTTTSTPDIPVSNTLMSAS